MASLISVKAKDNVLNRDLLLFSNPNTTKGRHDITIKMSLDGGVTGFRNINFLLRIRIQRNFSLISFHPDIPS